MDSREIFRSIVLILVGAAFFFVQELSPAGTFFGRTVDPEFPQRADGRRIRSRYRRLIAAITAIALVALHLGPAGYLVARALLFFGGTLAWVFAGKQAREFVREPSSIRTASLAPRDRSLPGGRRFFFGPIWMIVITGVLAMALRPDLQFGLRQGPEPLLGVWVVGLLCSVFLLWLAHSVLFRTRRVAAAGAAAQRESAFRRISFIFG